MRKYCVLIILFSTVILIQTVGAMIIFCHFGIPEKSGEFGDTFGAINTLFSGLAFCGVIYTVFLQSKELALQREELKLTRYEINASTKAQEQQASYLLLSAQINAAISKQEIYSSHYLNQKMFPGHEDYELGDMREHLKSLMDDLDKLISQAKGGSSV